jgi:hypothetical protein
MGTHNVKKWCEMFTGKRRSHTKMSPLPRVLAYQWNALTNLYGMLGGENLGVMVY